MNKNLYLIKISIKDSKPLIWRRLLIESGILLPELHKIIQSTMGWTNSHLHHFIKNDTFYTVKLSADDFWDDLNNVDYRNVRLNDLLKKEKETIVYEYDFGDGWEHNVFLEKILPMDNNSNYPVCLAGKMNCPTEDCGGIWGYSAMLKIIKDPGHTEYKTYMDWLGGEFDPEYFNKEEVNELLKKKDYGCSEL